jgi:hypothetical protein
MTVDFREGEQYRQCTYNVTMRRFLSTIVAVEKQELLHNLCVFVALGTQQAMRRAILSLWSAPLYNIFPHYLINGTIYGKTLLNIKCVF